MNEMITRRRFNHSLAASAAAGLSSATSFTPGAVASTGDGDRKRIAFLGTSVYRHSHAQHFLDRLAAGYAYGGRWIAPRLEVASVYIDQFPENDLGRQRIDKYGLQQFPTIAEALTLGGDQLAVDGVVIIGEHGNYPRTELGQVRYPRYDWFKQVVEVFQASGRSVPVFNDKHLSTSWQECAEMVADARRLDFPFYAGSSLPVTWRLPQIELPRQTPLSESVCVAYGGVDSYDIHALETAQCMSEWRRGGEVGVRSVKALQDEACWDHLAQRRTTRRLVVSALCRSHNLPVDGGYPTAPVDFDWARQSLPKITGYFVEHLDGFQTAIFLTGIRDFNYAGLRSDEDEIVGCQFMLPMPGSSATTADFFTPLVRHIEQMILEGRTAYPIERTLLTSGIVIAGLQSLQGGGQAIATPQLEIAYRPTESMHWRV